MYTLQLMMCLCSTKGRASLVIGKQSQRRRQQGLRWQWQRWQISSMVLQLSHFINHMFLLHGQK